MNLFRVTLNELTFYEVDEFSSHPLQQRIAGRSWSALRARFTVLMSFAAAPFTASGAVAARCPAVPATDATAIAGAIAACRAHTSVITLVKIASACCVGILTTTEDTNSRGRELTHPDPMRDLETQEFNAIIDGDSSQVIKTSLKTLHS